MSGSDSFSPSDGDNKSASFKAKINSQRKNLYGLGAPKFKGSIPRPKILNKKRADRSQLDDAWSQRCVDVFDILDQIGEGTYGHVYKAKPKGGGIIIILSHRIVVFS